MKKLLAFFMSTAFGFLFCGWLTAKLVAPVGTAEDFGIIPLIVTFCLAAMYTHEI